MSWEVIDRAALYALAPSVRPKKKTSKPHRPRRKTVSRKIWGYQAELRRKPTKAEKRVKKALDELGSVAFKFQHVFKLGKRVAIVDFWFPDLLLVLEVDGGYHNTHEQITADWWRDKLFADHGITTIRVTNKQTNKGLSEILKDILTAQMSTLHNQKLSKSKQRKIAKAQPAPG